MPAQKALTAIAHKLGLIAYRVLTNKIPYQEQEIDNLPSPNRARLLRRSIRLIQDLGGKVEMPLNPPKN